MLRTKVKNKIIPMETTQISETEHVREETAAQKREHENPEL